IVGLLPLPGLSSHCHRALPSHPAGTGEQQRCAALPSHPAVPQFPHRTQQRWAGPAAAPSPHTTARPGRRHALSPEECTKSLPDARGPPPGWAPPKPPPTLQHRGATAGPVPLWDASAGWVPTSPRGVRWGRAVPPVPSAHHGRSGAEAAVRWNLGAGGDSAAGGDRAQPRGCLCKESAREDSEALGTPARGHEAPAMPVGTDTEHRAGGRGRTAVGATLPALSPSLWHCKDIPRCASWHRWPRPSAHIPCAIFMQCHGGAHGSAVPPASQLRHCGHTRPPLPSRHRHRLGCVTGWGGTWGHPPSRGFCPSQPHSMGTAGKLQN
ncbi:proline-rich receptor-like protein kinase PERK2, partial [Phasianus colchicus]|uniref:proline-rich receptor-like protein kinase PERK2 n=1 Tax=Phasianus colchicus TaxID=9054 RepID=UPI00129E20D4